MHYVHIEHPLPFKPCIAPDDPEYRDQWHLNYAYNPMADIRAELAWNINRGRNDVIIAVCDGGVDYTHEDLDPGDRSRVVAGYDFGSGDSDPMDNLPDNATLSYAGHGTHVAGIIGAITHNGKHVSGVMWNCKIMPVKMVGGSTFRGPFGGTIHDFSTTALPSDVANAIDYAVNNGAHVINLSYGFSAIGFPINEVILKIPLLYSTIASAYNRNVVVVAAMGNEHEEGNPTNYPAGFAHEVIAVGNTTSNFQRATSSSTGNHIDVSAPGSSILSTIRGGGTDTKSGTSMAAPVVSGIAGLIISQGLDRGFNLTNDDVLHILEKTADDIFPTGWDTETGYGKVNAYRAMSLINTPNELYHWVSYGGTTTKINLNKWIYTGGGRWGLASGMYLNVDRYQVTKHITFDIPFCSPPTVWLRDRESESMSFGNPNDGFPYAEITNVTETGFDVKFCTYYVRYNSVGQTINKWVPATTASTKIAYTAVGAPNAAGTTGPIMGESLICSSNSAFSIQNLPTGCSISWDKSSNLTYVSGQNTNNYVVSSNGNGEGWIKAIVNSGCGNVTLPQKTVWVGIPVISYISGNQHAAAAQMDEIYYAEPYNALAAASYSWQVSPSYYTLWSSGNEARISFPYDGDYWVTANAQNICGVTDAQLFVAVGIYEPYSIFPNPADDFFTITLTDNKVQEASSVSNAKIAFDLSSNASYSVNILNSMGMPVFSTKSARTSFSIPTSNLKDGSYIVVVDDGKKSYRKHLMVKH
ncbi:MAG: S8 family serine peptidase [Tenuifilaceae bacterium]